MTVDLTPPLDDFYDRTAQIKRVIALAEAASRDTSALQSPRRDIDLSLINLSTGNTANSMAIVFLASSFEEFVREEVSLCGSYLSICYGNFDQNLKHKIRNNYWNLCNDRFKYIKGILTNDTPKVVDLNSIGKIRGVVESVRGFVLMDDPDSINGNFFGNHSNNFKPAIVNEVVGRIGLKNIMSKVAESHKTKRHFGVTRKDDAEQRLTSKLNTFYDTRNEIVHSLSSSTGYGVDVLLDYVDIFEISAEAMKLALEDYVGGWQRGVA